MLIQENTDETAVCKMVAILFRRQRVNLVALPSCVRQQHKEVAWNVEGNKPLGPK